MVDILGYLAAACTTVSFIPQLVLVLKTRDTRSISLSMYIIFTVGLAFWLAYGIWLISWPMIVANTLTLVSSVAILCVKMKNHKADVAAERALRKRSKSNG